MRRTRGAGRHAVDGRFIEGPWTCEGLSDSDIELIVGPSRLENDELYFNAARSDRSMVLKTSDYVALAQPRLERIAEGFGTPPGVVPGS